MDAIRRIVRVLRESSRGAEKAVGLSGAQLFVLQRLGGGPLSINALAAATATHQSSVSVVVGRLVERRLVTRGVSATDARRREVALTAAGRKLLAQAPGAAQERLIAGLVGLSRAARRALVDHLEAVVVGMGAGDEPADMFFEDRGELVASHGSRPRAAITPPADPASGQTPPRRSRARRSRSAVRR